MSFRQYLLSNVLRSPDDGAAPPAAEVVEIKTTGSNAVMSAREAAQALAGARHKRTNPEADQPAPTETAAETPPTPSGDEPDAALPETEATGDEPTESAPDPAAKPSIEPPRSWSKDARERWSKLDPETQEYLLSRDRDDTAAVRKAQNEAAEQRKAIEADRVKVEQVRTQYETALPALLDTIQQQQNLEFADIKTIEDVTKLAREDWPRYVMWDSQQKRLAAVQQQVEAAKQRQSMERRQKFGEFVQKEAELFAEKVPEFADPAKKSALQDKAVAMLRELGFKDQELGELGRGEKELSIYDHRVQLLINDGLRFRAAQAAVKNPSAKPVPAVVRPGISQPRGAVADAAVQNLAKRLDQTGNVRDAARLLAARRTAAR